MRFLALFDLHYGKEKRDGKVIELHDPGALAATLQFAQDFAPEAIVLGGDMLDCGAISHHADGKPRQIEGLRLLADMEGLRRDLLGPIESIGARKLVYHVGNHEHWIEQLVDRTPGIEGLVGLERLLPAPWEIIPQGGVSRLGKLHFIHGDQIRSSQWPARVAVDTFEKSIRLGHFHRAQLWTKTSALDIKDIRTGMVVPCLARKDPAYMRGSPCSWAQGFLWGDIESDGSFSDYLTFINRGRFRALGKEYRG